MTSSTVNEIKDINTEMLLDNCIREGIIKIEDVDYSKDEEIMDVVKNNEVKEDIKIEKSVKDTVVQVIDDISKKVKKAAKEDNE